MTVQNQTCRMQSGAVAALEAALASGLNTYDRHAALRRFHRLAPETIAAETPEAARAVLREIERAMRRERARIGHWSYDLNQHISLLIAHRAESARLQRLTQQGARRKCFPGDPALL